MLKREYYEGPVGGWADGRLGQAYDLIDAVMGDLPPESAAYETCRKALQRVGDADAEIGRDER